MVRRLIALRKEYPALGNVGKVNFTYARKGVYPLVFERSGEWENGETREDVVIVLNPSAEKVSCPDFGVEETECLIHYGGIPKPAGRGALAVPPESFCWLKRKSAGGK